MFHKVLVALAVLQFTVAGQMVWAASSGDVDEIKQLRNSAVEAQARGQLDAALGLYTDAVRLAQRSYGSNSTYVGDLYFDMGMIAFGDSKYQKAEAWLSEAVKRNPYSVTARMKLAELYRLKGQQRQARQLAQRVLSRNANSLEAREILALSYQDEGNVAKATQECARIAAVLDGKLFPSQQFKTESPNVESLIKPLPVKPQTPEKPEAMVVKEQPKPVAKEAPKPVKPAKPEKPATRVAIARPPKPKAKPQVKVAAAKPPVVKPAVATAGVYSEGPTSARLRSKAKLLTPIKNAKPRSTQAEETTTEEVSPETPAAAEETEAPKKEPPKPVRQAPKPPARPARPRAGLVPPPPPVVPVFPSMMPPPQQMPPPKPRAVEKPKPVEKPVERKEEPASSGGNEEDPDFLLQWADTGKKKK